MSDSLIKVCPSWWCRSIVILGAIIIGIVSLWSGFQFLLCYEHNVVYRAKTLEEGQTIVISLETTYIDEKYENQLVHLSGETMTQDTLIDEHFSVEVKNTIKLRRMVEMYQWQERQDTITKEGKVNYQYHKIWNPSYIDSSKFHQSGHDNPSWKVHDKVFIADPVTVGEFALSSNFVEPMNHYQWYPMMKHTFEQVQEKFHTQFPTKQLQFDKGNYYIGQNPLKHQIGDVRVRFEVVLPETVSIIAKQKASRLIPYQTKAGGNIELFEYGNVNATQMWQYTKMDSFINALPIRFLSFLTLFIGLYMIFFVLRKLINFPPLDEDSVKAAKHSFLLIVIVLLCFMGIAFLGDKRNFLFFITTLLIILGTIYLVLLSFYILFFKISDLLTTMLFWEYIALWANWMHLMIIAATISLLTIAMIWIDYSKLLGILLILLAITVLYGLIFARRLWELPPIFEMVVPQKENAKGSMT
jgi:hypothetical protein